LTYGKRLIWEYPRGAAKGEQMDFVEAMELNEGLIQRHCVYWGWRGNTTADAVGAIRNPR
jgi:hypothetical protein